MAEQTTQVSTASEGAAVARRPRLYARIGDLIFRWREASILIVGIALVIYFWAANSNFTSSDNRVTLLQYAAPWVILASGEVMLLILGEIDLSVGNTYALAPFIMYYTYTDFHVPLWLGVVLAVFAGTIVGFVNGAITVILRVPSFITTLGMYFLLSGITLTISSGTPQLTPGGSTFTNIMGGSNYSEIIWAVAVVVVVQFILSRTPWGLHTIAVGGNLLGASESGINVGLIKIGNFMLAGGLAAFTGILDAVRISETDPTAGGTDIMFSAVVAAVIGGTALVGGSGTVVGALIGALVLAVLRDGFTLQGISAYTYDIILGAAILIAMIANIRLQRLRQAGK